jgi:hypothetical protein
LFALFSELLLPRLQVTTLVCTTPKIPHWIHACFGQVLRWKFGLSVNQEQSLA